MKQIYPHTPGVGPWTLAQVLDIGIGNNYAVVSGDVEIGWFRDKRDALLAKSAPEMADFLKELVGPVAVAMNTADRLEAFRDIARAILAKLESTT